MYSVATIDASLRISHVSRSPRFRSYATARSWAEGQKAVDIAHCQIETRQYVVLFRRERWSRLSLICVS